ncbi:uncharacterized protein LOC114262002 [Camellia sinensis]|uniref:uncharacterized protein LOC114262002 n=1 Tax=Camellia sinensis TaxID=4442 RepID=UPI0010369B1E|nr:uncharacterized protein LOC114262002 [Camellia sinensis]
MKGLRQGDPLSPFLFNIVAESLNLLMSRAKEVGLIRGASIGPNDLRLSHIQFADDTIIFCKADWEEIIAIKRILRCFEILSGLKINFHKSQVYGIGVQDNLVKEFANRLNCHSQKLPLKYLGLPLGANPRRNSTWQPVVDNFKKKLALWKRMCLFFAGRDVLSVNLSNPALSVFFFNYVKTVVGNGRRIQFWVDRWFSNQSLSEAFPRLFSLSTEKGESLLHFVQRKGKGRNWKLAFRRPLFAWEEKEVSNLNVLLHNAPTINALVEDSCLWLAHSSGFFTVASVWKSWNHPKVLNECLFKEANPDFAELTELVNVRVALWAKSNLKESIGVSLIWSCFWYWLAVKVSWSEDVVICFALEVVGLDLRLVVCLLADLVVGLSGVPGTKTSGLFYFADLA